MIPALNIIAVFLAVRWRRATVRATIIKRHGLPRFRPIKQHWCVEQNPTKRRARLNFTAEGSDVPLVSGISHSCGIGGLPAPRLMGRHETLLNLLRMQQIGRATCRERVCQYV